MEKFKYPAPVTTRRDSPNLGPAGQAFLLVLLLLPSVSTLVTTYKGSGNESLSA